MYHSISLTASHLYWEPNLGKTRRDLGKDDIPEAHKFGLNLQLQSEVNPKIVDILGHSRSGLKVSNEHRWLLLLEISMFPG